MLMIAANLAFILSVQEQVDPESSKPDDQKVVCKREAKTGTRFPTKICKTRAQWVEITESTKHMAAENFNKPSINGERGD